MRRITTILFAFALIGLLASPATAQLFKDDFTGAVGDSLTKYGYFVQSSGANPISIVSPGLTYGVYPGSGVDNAAGLKNTGQDLGMYFPSDSVGSLYASFMLNLSAAQTGDYFFAFSPKSALNNYALRLFAKTDSASGFFLGVSKSNENSLGAMYGSTHLALNTTYLVVVKYTFVPGDSNDLCSVYALSGGNLPETEPLIPEINNYNGHSRADNSTLGSFTLRQGSTNATATLTFDGIRIDTSWAGALGFVPVPEFSVTPSVQSFGRVWVDSTKTDSLTVSNISRKASLVIDSVKSSNGKFVVAPTDGTVDTMQSVKFAITYHPTALGSDTGLVVFYHNAPSHQDTVVLTGTGAEKAAALVLESDVAPFGRVLVGGSTTDSVKIKNTGELALTISSVTSKDTATFGVALDNTLVPAGDSTYVRVTFHPKTTGVKADTIVFESNAPEGSDTLFVNGTADVPKAIFSLTPKAVAFGTIRAGQQKSDTLMLKNPGELTLKISGITQNDTTFHLVLEADSVKSGDSTRLFVRFAPMAGGTYRDTVVFTSNAADGNDTLTLSGIASDVITMAAARALQNGTEVIVRGIVTRLKGAYTFLQDTTGGIIMYSNVAGAPGFDSVASGYIMEGDLLEIDGKTSEFNALKEIAGADILSFRRISRGNPLPAAQVVTLAEIASQGEQYEAELVTIKKAWFPTASGTFAASTTYTIVDSSDASGAVAFRVQSARDSYLVGLDVPTGKFTYTGVVGQFSSSNPATGYQLLPVDTLDVVAEPVQGVSNLPTGVPTVFELGQNFPNPFNPATTIQYGLPVESRVTVKIYSVLGQEVRTLVSETQKASYYRIVWDGLNASKAPVATGIYFYRINAEPAAKEGAPFVQVRKMLMLK